MTDRQQAILRLLHHANEADLTENQISILLVSELLASYSETLEAIYAMCLEQLPNSATQH
jgi:hypothetical protein